MEVPTLQEFLAFLYTPSGLAVLGTFMSLRLAAWPWYNGFTNDTLKKALFVGTTAGIAIVAYVLVTYVPQGVFDAVAPFWAIIGAALAVLVGDTVFRGVLKPLRALTNGDHA